MFQSLVAKLRLVSTRVGPMRMSRLWPAAKRSLDYCIATWDPDHTGTLVEPHHNTYDIEFWGADGMCTSFYAGALAAKPRSGRKPTVRNNCREQVLQMLRDDLALTGKRRSIRAIAEACKVSKDTVHRIAQQMHTTAPLNAPPSRNDRPLDPHPADPSDQSPASDNQ